MYTHTYVHIYTYKTATRNIAGSVRTPAEPNPGGLIAISNNSY